MLPVNSQQYGNIKDFKRQPGELSENMESFHTKWEASKQSDSFVDNLASLKITWKTFLILGKF